MKKVHEGVFKHLVRNCTINRDFCKRACLIGAFIQHLIHFWLGFLGLVFRSHICSFGADLLKKFHEGVFKHLVLSCSRNSDVCKRACLIVAFLQHLTHFW